MPWITIKEAVQYNYLKKEDKPEEHWCYLYDMSTEQLIFIGRPYSPSDITYCF
tara:strand:- start:53 stop:211 length:159 start_codon:yes stop_codon:yes gene_type:complete